MGTVALSARHDEGMALLGWIAKAAVANVRCLFGHDPVPIAKGEQPICRRCFRRV